MTPPKAGSADVLDLIRVDPGVPGRFSGMCIDGAIGRVFGGQALAQALRAVSLATDDRRPIHSIHAAFIGAASSTSPMLYTTDIVKSGRSLDVIGFRASQADRTMLYGFASTHAPEPTMSMSDRMPSVPGPDDVSESDQTPDGTNPAVRSPFELRSLTTPSDPARQEVWIRSRVKVDSDAQIDHAALLTYAVDFLVTRAAHARLPPSISLLGASLDHAMWFHRPFRIDEWLLVSSSMSSYSDSRSLCDCQVFDADGSLVATAIQEALIRPEVLRGAP
jgi:acyl-CoA thioesterase-2